MSYDSILSYLGEFGAYQKRKVLYVAVACIPNALHACSVVFDTVEPPFRCAVPGLDNDTYAIKDAAHQRLVDAFVPLDSDTGHYAQCEVFDGSWNGSTSGSSHGNQTVNCRRWVYDPTWAASSPVADWDLVCEHKPFKVHFNSMVMLGLLVGSLFGGALADFFGRRNVLISALVLQAFFGTGMAFVTSPVLYLVIRFILAFFCISTYMSSFVLVTEFVGPKWRTYAEIATLYGWSIGLFVLPLIRYCITDWRKASLVISIPWFACVAYFWLLDESPRWLIVKGRVEQAKKAITNIANTNGTTMPDDMELKASVETKDADKIPQLKVWHFCTSKVLVLRLVILSFGWCTASMVYFGLTLNVGSLIKGDIYVNFTVQSVLEVLSYLVCMLLLSRTGRKTIYCASLLLAGVACLTMTGPVFAKSDIKWINILLFGLGKFGITGSFTLVYIVTTELLPTPLRNSGLGFCSFLGRIAAVLSPYIATVGDTMSSDYGKAFPMVIFGAFGVTASLTALCLPESRNRKLPETIEECRNMERATQCPATTAKLSPWSSSGLLV